MLCTISNATRCTSFASYKAPCIAPRTACGCSRATARDGDARSQHTAESGASLDNKNIGGKPQPAGCDPGAAQGFAAPEGERPLWWVEQFEARRRAQAAAASSGSGQEAGKELPGPDEPKQQEAAAAAAPDGQHNRVLAALSSALQLLQLAVVTGALILWPASLQPGGLLVGRVWLLYLAYLVFFGSGTLSRLQQHGQLSPRSKDRQRTSSWGSRLAFVAFVAAVPILHWLPLLRYTGGRLSYEFAAYDVLGLVCILGAMWLNVAASRQLGKAYDRVVAPDKLVTSGVYRFVQHPIYTSYMLLFTGFCLSLHSAPSALLMLAVCALYYRVRCNLEAQVLREAFGKAYEDYATATKRFIPFLV